MYNLPFFNAAFAQVLRSRREQAGMTQLRLAFEIGGSEIAVRKLERGVQTPTVTTFILISRAFNIQPAILLNETLERMSYLEDIGKENERLE